MNEKQFIYTDDRGHAFGPFTLSQISEKFPWATRHCNLNDLKLGDSIYDHDGDKWELCDEVVEIVRTIDPEAESHAFNAERRERIATEILKALWSRSGSTDMTCFRDHPDYETMTYERGMAIHSIKAAEAFIAELDKVK